MVRNKLVLFGRAVTRVERGSGGRAMRYVSTIGAALMGMVVITAAPRAFGAGGPGSGRSSPADSHKPAKASAEHVSRAHGKRVSAKGSSEAARHARRRSGSGVAADKPSPGEVVGGLGGHKDPKARAASKSASKAGAPHRVARV